ncbi:MAG TPA: flagellar hook-basal body complex protein FliE [Vicinamibacterales bacterium]
MALPIAPIASSVTTPVAPAAAGAASNASSSSPASFGDALTKLVNSVESSESTANTAVQGMLDGSGDVHDAMIALQRAELTLQLTVQMRNKLVQAYQDIMRMPV